MTRLAVSTTGFLTLIVLFFLNVISLVTLHLAGPFTFCGGSTIIARGAENVSETTSESLHNVGSFRRKRHKYCPVNASDRRSE